MQKIEAENAPKAIGPYSHAVKAGDFLFVSGQLPLNPKTGQLAPATIQDQTRQVLANIEAILTAAGLTWKNVVRCEVFLKDLQDFKEMNTIYAEKFPHDVKPARHAFQVAKLPMDALVEISCIAHFSS